MLFFAIASKNNSRVVVENVASHRFADFGSIQAEAPAKGAYLLERAIGIEPTTFSLGS